MSSSHSVSRVPRTGVTSSHSASIHNRSDLVPQCFTSSGPDSFFLVFCFVFVLFFTEGNEYERSLSRESENLDLAPEVRTLLSM